MGFNTLFNGTNLDDQGDYRPGLVAADEHDVKSPLLASNFTKKDIREVANHLGLSNADKPASACLASRVPYGTAISSTLLKKIEQAESILSDYGFTEYRARDHGEIVRIEINPNEFEKLLNQRSKIESEMKQLGYVYVTLDLKGFRSGSMNETHAMQKIITISA